MRFNKKIAVCFLLSGITLFSFSCDKKGPDDKNKNTVQKNVDDRVYSGEAYASEELKGFLSDSSMNLMRGQVLIKDKQTLIAIAEPILFKIYGKEQIIDERPYEIFLLGDYWIMSGTLRRGWVGGTFTIAINRITCEVVGITHGK